MPCLQVLPDFARSCPRNVNAYNYDATTVYANDDEPPHATTAKIRVEQYLLYYYQYSHIWNMLQHMTPQNLASIKPTWHRKCYQDLIHVEKLKILQARYDSESDGPQLLLPMTRMP